MTNCITFGANLASISNQFSWFFRLFLLAISLELLTITHLFLFASLLAQVLAVLLTIIGLIIIKVADGEAEEHGQLGIAIIVLCIFQMLLGAARNIVSGKDASSTDPDDKGPRCVCMLSYCLFEYASNTASCLRLSSFCFCLCHCN